MEIVSFYDRDGNPINVAEWSEKFERGDYKIVEQDAGSGVTLLTAWIGDFTGTGEEVVAVTSRIRPYWKA